MGASRTYHSPLRTERARQTRRRIVASAHVLFEERGYGGTTIDAVAERAGVSRRTVFSSVGAKAELLKTAWDWAVAGDDQPVAVVARPVVAEMKAEPDLHRLVVLWVRHVVTIGDRVAGLAVALSRAADADPEAASLVERIDEERRTGARGFVSHLQARGVLRPGLTVEAGADMCWMLANPMVLRRLRDERGWTTGEVQDWLVRLVEASLFE